RVDQALMETMMISIPNPASNGVSMHTIKVEYEWKPPRCETCLVFGHDDAHCPKRVIADLKNLSKHGGTSNDGFQTGQRKCIRDPLVSKHGTRGNHSLLEQQVPNSVFQKKTSILMSNAFYALEDDNGKPMDDLFDDIRKKVGVPPRKTGIWLSMKGESLSKSGFTSHNPSDFLTKEYMKSILRNPWESDDADVENGYNETATFVASTSLALLEVNMGFAGWDLVCNKNIVHVLTIKKGFLSPKGRLRCKGVKEKDCLAADDSDRTRIRASKSGGSPSCVVPNEASYGPNVQVSGLFNDSSGNNVSHDTTLNIVVETVTTMPTYEVPSPKSFVGLVNNKANIDKLLSS
ncbi:putative polyprotein, partial [Tanacetum coccineum]